MRCPTVRGLSMWPFSVGCPGPPYRLSAEPHENEAGTARTHIRRAQHHFHSIVLVKESHRPAKIQGGDIGFISPTHMRERNYWWPSSETTAFSPPPIPIVFPSSQRCNVYIWTYSVWHKLVVVNDSCLCLTPGLILWFSLHLGINLCVSNITSLFGGTIYGHIKLLLEYNFFVNRISTLMCNSFSSFKTQLNLTSSIKFLLIIPKKMGFLSF